MIAKAGETRGSRTALSLLFFFFFFWPDYWYCRLCVMEMWVALKAWHWCKWFWCLGIDLPHMKLYTKFEKLKFENLWDFVRLFAVNWIFFMILYHSNTSARGALVFEWTWCHSVFYVGGCCQFMHGYIQLTSKKVNFGVRTLCSASRGTHLLCISDWARLHNFIILLWESRQSSGGGLATLSQQYYPPHNEPVSFPAEADTHIHLDQDEQVKSALLKDTTHLFILKKFLTLLLTFKIPNISFFFVSDFQDNFFFGLVILNIFNCYISESKINRISENAFVSLYRILAL